MGGNEFQKAKTTLGKYLKDIGNLLIQENLSRDMYLISEMISDQYVPITNVANFDHIKKLSTDVDLIVEVLRSLTLVQVNEKERKKNPCIVILSELSKSTLLKK